MTVMTVSPFSLVRGLGKIDTNNSGDLRLNVMSPAAHRLQIASSTALSGRGFGFLGLFVCGSLWAQLPAARVSHLFPPGGRSGTSFEVVASGSHLDEPARIHFSRSSLGAEPKGEGGKFTVTIASNTPPGVYEARFVGRFGVSNPRPFVVGPLPETTAPTTNTSTASAAELKPETTVNGRVSANTVSWFRFTAKKSQRLFIECLAESLDSRMDAMLALTDTAGRELERARTSGLIDFTAPADGSYLLKVSDFLYRGGDDYFYRLTLSPAPRLDFAFPPAGQPGTKTNITLYGRNLPGGKPAKGLAIDGKPLEQLSVEVSFPADERARRLDTGLRMRPADAALEGFEYRLKSPKGVSNPLLLGLATAPVLLEQEPNSRPEQAQKLSPPCEVAGQFHPGGEQDWFTFEAKKGDTYWIEVVSHRLGLNTDPFVLVQRVTKNEKGEEQSSDVQELNDIDTNLGDREFNTATRDPAGRFEAKEDGTHRVMVRDLFQRAERSPRFVYRLSVRQESPDFRLAALSVVPRLKADAKNIDIGVPLLRRGETISVRVMVFRRDGFNGDIQLSIENPPPGLVFEGDKIEAGKNFTFILLTAAEDAPAFAGPIRLVGRAKVGDKELVRQAHGGTMVFAVGNTDSERPESRVAREFALAISDKESAPLSMATSERKTWEAPANGKLEIPLAITRRGEFNANLKLKPLGPGTAEALKEFDADGKATNATLTLDFAALKLAAGEYVFAVQSQTTGKYRNNPEAAAFAEAAAKEADKAAGELAAELKKAAKDLEEAAKTAQEAEAGSKNTTEKLAAAKVALEKSPEDEKLKAELAAAEKAATEATKQAGASVDAKSAAEKNKTAAEAKAKEAQAKKESTAARAKEATEKAKPKDTTILVYSAPIKVRVTPAKQAKTEPGKTEQAKSK
jgi:hypothetical protein